MPKKDDPTGGYILCTTPRSGSTLLCRMLAQCSAGDPESLFYRPDMTGWANRMGVPLDGPAQAVMRRITASAVQIGRGDTPIFGLRQQRPSFPAFCDALAAAYPKGATDLDRLELAFGPLRFIHLHRENKVRQAVSFCLAQHTGLWHLNTDGTDFERNAPKDPGEITINKIASWVAAFTSYDQAWLNWFRAQEITPLSVTYEALSNDPIGILRSVLRYLDLDPARADGIEPPLRKIANPTTEDWVNRVQVHVR